MPKRRPRLELLEDRLAPASFTVNDPGDEGDGDPFDDKPETEGGKVTLRSVLEFINSNKFKDGSADIGFNGPMTINVGKDRLPNTRDDATVTFDGSPHATNGKPGVAVLGHGNWTLSSTNVYDGLTLGGPATVRALTINGFQDGIFILSDTDQVTIENCYVGTNMAGDAAGTRQHTGIYAKGATNGVTIRDNVVSGQEGSGVVFGRTPTNLTVTGNKIGTDKTGTMAVKNGQDGLSVFGNSAASGSVIGGAGALANVLSGNFIAGLSLGGSGASGLAGLRVVGNRIGVGIGDESLPNGYGIASQSTGGVLIGGAGEGNVIAANLFDGVFIQGGGGNKILGNWIGTTQAGADGRGNGGVGVGVSAESNSADGNEIGGTATGSENVIVRNAGGGVVVNKAAGTKIWGNFIGTDKSRTKDFGNGGSGVVVTSDATDTQVGGSANGSGNLIVGSTGAGIRIGPSSGTTVRGNTVGVLPDGSKRPNAEGIAVLGATDVTIGGGGADDRNTVSGNTGDGITITDAGTGVRVLGNVVGSSESVPDGNGGNGVVVTGGSGVTVGGLQEAEENDIWDNGGVGVVLRNGTGHHVARNTIGESSSGVSNRGGGVLVDGGEGHRIGSFAGEGYNMIWGNADFGVWIKSGTAHRVMRNDITGFSVTQDGVRVTGGREHVIGGDTADEGNDIFGMTGYGIVIDGSVSSSPELVRVVNNSVELNDRGGALLSATSKNVVSKNRFQSNATAGNAPGSVVLSTGSTLNIVEDNTINGGSSSTPELLLETGSADNFFRRNTIRSDSLADVVIRGSQSARNLLSRNTIAAPGTDGVIRLEGGNAPIGSPRVSFPFTDLGPLSFFTVSLPQLPTSSTYTVEVFQILSGTQTFLGSVSVAGSGGSATPTEAKLFTFASVAGRFVATVTDPDNNTSEFRTSNSISSRPRIQQGQSVQATSGVHFEAQIVVSGEPTPTLTIVSNLPSGVTFNAATRTLSGTPAPGTVGDHTLTVRAVNSEGVDETTLVLTIVAVSPPPPPPPSPPPPPPVPQPVLVGGSPNGTASPLTPSSGQYAPGSATTMFPGLGVNVRTATADVNGDGVLDLIGGTGPGHATQVVVLDGKTNATIATFAPFEASFVGGVFVTAADMDGDGKAEVVVSPDQGGGPIAAIYSGAKLAAGLTGDAAQIIRYFAIDDKTFLGGARPTLGDLNGDGKPELAVSAGFLGGPRITVWDGASILALAPRQLLNFFAFESTLRNGAFVSSGDVTGDGRADLIFGGGPGGAPRVRIFDGQALLAAAGTFSTLDEVGSAQRANFFAGDSSLRGGVRLAMRDVDGNGKADLVTGSGEGEASRVRVFLSANLLGNAAPVADQELDPFGSTLANGVFVG